MQTKSIEHESLELKVFAFSIDVVSFVKSLEKSGITNTVTRSLLNLANGFYSSYLAAEKALGEYAKNCFFEESKENAKTCLELLQSIDVEKELLNEKVDLIIEVDELIRIIDSGFK